MKLLLLYPQPADRPKSRLSRAGAQLADIATTVRSILHDNQSSTLSVQEFAYDYDTPDSSVKSGGHRHEIKQAFDESDLVLDISLASEKKRTSKRLRRSCTEYSSCVCRFVCLQ